MGRLAAHGNKGVESGLNLKIEIVGKVALPLCLRKKPLSSESGF